MGAAVDTTLGLTVDREPPRGLIDLPLRRDPLPGRGIVWGVAIGLLLWLAGGVAFLIVREVMRWAGV